MNAMLPFDAARNLTRHITHAALTDGNLIVDLITAKTGVDLTTRDIERVRQACATLAAEIGHVRDHDVTGATITLAERGWAAQEAPETDAR